MGEFTRVARFRARSDELRRKADEFGPENRDMLLQMAANDDAIATQFVNERWSRDL